MSPQEQLTMRGKQLEIILKQLANLQRLVVSKNGGAPKVVYQPVVIGVKDVSSSQLLDAYKKGLNLEQLCQLADGKYTAEQIVKKLQKMGVR